MPQPCFKNPITTKIVDFLRTIGFEVRMSKIEGRTFVPGIQIEHGALVVDETQLLYPGDLLHEAGHLAVVLPNRRKKLYIDAGKKAAEEMMAIAWSYAAGVHLELDLAIVFHENGYRGGGSAIIENFSQGRYFGVPTLQWLGLTAEGKRATELGVSPYPHMLKWMLDEADEQAILVKDEI